MRKFTEFADFTNRKNTRSRFVVPVYRSWEDVEKDQTDNNIRKIQQMARSKYEAK